MRERKYRAWDKKHNEWYRTSISEMLTYYGFYLFGECTMIEPPHAEDLPNLIITEFTGLQDKNGVDIYEGDIVRLSYTRDDLCYGEIEETYIMKVYFGSGSFWMSGDGLSINGHFHYNNEDREVIGNIFENPGLLGE